MTMHTPKRSRIRRGSAVALTLLVITSLFSACEPAPPPTPRPGDGVDLGLITNGVPAVMGAGRANDYAVQVANFGTATATNASFWVFAPLSFSVDGTIDGVECDQGGNNGQDTSFVGCTIGDIAPGQTITIDLEAWLGDWTTPRDVTYGVASDGGEAIPDPHPNSIKIPTTSNRPAFSAPTLNITSPQPSASYPSNYEIYYGGTATDEVDGDLSNQIHWSYVPAGVPDATPTTLTTWNAGHFHTPGEGIYVVIASVTNSSGATTRDTRVVTVGPARPDGRDLGLDTSGVTSTLTIGDTPTESVVVHNYGTAPATGAQLVITAPVALGLTATTGGDDNECRPTTDDDTATTIITCNVGLVDAISPGGAATVSLQMHVDAPIPDATVDFTATSDNLDPIPDPHPNSASVTASTRYAAPPTLEVTAPTENASVSSAVAVPYAASASTATGTDLSSQITWTSTDADDPEAEPTPLPTGASGTVGPLASGNYTLTAHVDDGAGQSTTVTRTLTVHDPIVDTTTGLAVLMPNAPTSVPAGVTTTFPVTIHNYGTTTVTGLRLSIGSADAMHAKFAKSWWGGGDNTGTEKFEIGLASGASVTYLMRVTPDVGTTSASLTATLKNSSRVQVDSTSAPVTVTDADPSAPSLTITAPQATNTDFATTADLATAYSATASDPTDGDLSGQVVWTLTSLNDATETVTALGTGASGSIDPLDPGIYLLRGSVTDSVITTATSAVVITVLPTNMSCSTVANIRQPSGLYLPQNMTIDAARSYDTCGRPMQFYWDAVYTAVSEQDRLDFNANMNNAAQDVVAGNFTLQQPDEWLINMVICTPALGSIAAQCALPVSRDYASSDVWTG